MRRSLLAILAASFASVMSLQAQIAITIQPNVQVTNFATGQWAALSGIPNTGENVVIPVVASGAGTLTYQWQRNGTNLVTGATYTGTTTPALGIPGITTNAAGIYTVIVGNGGTSITSAPVILSVRPPMATYTWKAYDLQAQFTTNGASSGTSPAGWQYCEGLAWDSENGITPGGLPLASFVGDNLDANWNQGDFGAGQPGWDGNNGVGAGSAAGWAQRANNGTISNTPNHNKDALLGQIVSYQNSAIFVVPSTLPPGVANLAGGLWNLRHLARSGTWRIFHNDGNVTAPLATTLTSGSIGDTSGDSEGPLSFDQGQSGAAALQGIPYSPGDTFRIDSDEPDFVGWHFTVYLSSASDPGLTVVPTNQFVPVGANVTLTATAVGTGPFTYQWQLFGTNLPGATSSSLALSNARTNQSGPYVVIVSNSNGTFTSPPATITVYSGVYVASQPTPFLVTNAASGVWSPASGIFNGGEIVFSTAAAGGNGPFTYQWKLNGTNVPGQTNATLMFNASPGLAGSYTVVAANATNSAISQPVILGAVYPNIPTFSGTAFDLAAQFSTTGAASGTTPLGWQYCEGLAYDSQTGISPGGLPLPSFVAGTLDGNWNSGDLGPGQPGWDGHQPGGHAGWSQRVDNGTIDNTPNGNKDALPGMIMAYRNSAVWVVPTNVPPGVANIAGGVWNLRHFGRSGTWRIWYDAGNVTTPLPTPLSQGTILDAGGDSDGPISLDQGIAGPAALRNISCRPGDTFRIDSDEDDFVGWTFTVYVNTNIGLAVVPVSQAVPASNTVTLTSQAVGAGPITYQWQFFGTNIPGATNATLVLANAQTNQSGAYDVVVSNPLGSIKSPAATVTIFTGVYFASPPSVFQVTNAATGVWPPLNGTFNSGELIFSSGAAAGGTGPFSYQWQVNGVNVPGFTNANLLFHASTNLAGTYTLVIGNGQHTVSSTPLTVAVYPPISVFPGYAADLQAQFSTNGPGPDGTASGWIYCEGLAYDSQNGVTPNGGYELLTFGSDVLDPNWNQGDFGGGQPGWDGSLPGPHAGWSQRVDNGTIDKTPKGAKDALPGMIMAYRNSAVYTVPTNFPAGTANLAGGIWNLRHFSRSGTFRVWKNDHNVTSPLPAPLTQGGFQDFTGDSDGPLSIEQGTGGAAAVRNIPYQPGDTFRIDSDTDDFIGWTFTVYLNSDPGITTSPTNLTVTVSNTATFTVVASGTGPFTYQWQFNGANLSGATSASLVLTNVQASQAGLYDVQVKNSKGTITSYPVTLTVLATLYVNSGPTFVVSNLATGTWPPSNPSFNSGETVVGSVSAGGVGVTYQWKLNNTTLAGQTNSTLTFVASSNSPGTYTVVLGNTYNQTLSVSNSISVYAAIAIYPGYAHDVKREFSLFSNPTTHGWQYSAALANQNNGVYGGVASQVVDPNWNSGDFGAGQPGWDGITPGAYAGWAQRVNNGTIDNTPNSKKDANVGDVCAYLDSVLLTIPTNYPAGTANVTGGIWNLRHLGRSGTWNVWYNDAVLLATGTIVDDAGSSTGPFNIANAGGGLTNISFNPGDTFRFETLNNDFVGVDFTVYTQTDPMITTNPPESVTLLAGQTLNISAGATGTGPLSYQWQLNGANIAGATSPTLALALSSTNASGKYALVASNSKGKVTSYPTVVDVLNVLPVLSVSGPSNGRLTINWIGAGVIQTSTNVAGPYTDVLTSTNSYSVPVTNAQQYFRVRAE